VRLSCGDVRSLPQPSLFMSVSAPVSLFSQVSLLSPLV
jgi:hypothetical protein